MEGARLPNEAKREEGSGETQQREERNKEHRFLETPPLGQWSEQAGGGNPSRAGARSIDRLIDCSLASQATAIAAREGGREAAQAGDRRGESD